MTKPETSTKINWKIVLIPIVLTAIATLSVTVAAPSVVEYFRTPDLKIQYYVQDTVPFKTQTNELATYQVTIKNEGTKLLENIVCQISFSDAFINQSTFFSEMPLDYNQTISNGLLSTKITNLNPQETAIVYVMATSIEELPKQPKVEVRASGVSGTQGSLTNESPGEPYLAIIGITVGLLSGGISQLILSRFSKKKEKEIEAVAKLDTDQKDNLIYLCGIHGLREEMERYQNLPSEVFYRREADRFSIIAIANPNETDARLGVLLDLLEYADIADVSKAIIQFNIGKIYGARGDVTNENAHLEAAKKICPDLVAKRLKIDPFFKKKD